MAGDIFDLFVGNKRIFKQRYSLFLDSVFAACKRGVNVHYIEGNHDFLMRRVFSGVPCFHWYASHFRLGIGGREFFFAHGDLVDNQDYGYRFLRAFFRSLFMRLFVWLAPDSWIEWIGNSSSRASKGRKPRLPTGLPAERVQYLRNVYRSYAAERLAEGCDFVVMGHCHDLDEKSFLIDGREGQYVNIGYPRAHGSFLSWNEGDEKIRRERLAGA